MKSIWTKVALAGVLCVSLGYAADYSEASNEDLINNNGKLNASDAVKRSGKIKSESEKKNFNKKSKESTKKPQADEKETNAVPTEKPNITNP